MAPSESPPRGATTIFEWQAEQARHELQREGNRKRFDRVGLGNVREFCDAALGDLKRDIRHALHARRRERSADGTAVARMHLAISDA